MRTVATALAGALALSGLSGCAVLGLSAPATPGASAAASAAPASPSPVPVLPGIVTPKPKTAAPALATAGTAWQPILTALSGYGQWLLANPDPALVANVATPGCAAAGALSRQLGALLVENAYVQTSPVSIVAVVGPAAAIGTRVRVTAVAARAAEPVLSRRKNTPIMTFGPLPATALSITLDRGADSKWRLCTVSRQSADGAPADATVPLV